MSILDGCDYFLSSATLNLIGDSISNKMESFSSFASSKPILPGSFYYSLIPPLVCIFFVARSLFTQLVMKIGPRKIFKSMEPKHESDFVQSLFYVLCLISSVTIGEMATRTELFRTNYDHTLIGWPENQVHSPSQIFYFTYCFSFYLYSLVDILIQERKRDFVAMTLHHVVTMITLFLSGYIEHPRMATCIMLLFDPCDIALEFAKIFTKIKEHTAAAISFVFFTGIWVRNRLWLYPFYLVPTILNAEVINGREIPYHPLHCAIVLIIAALNFYWTIFIVKKIRGIVKNGMSKECDKGDPRDIKTKSS